MEHLNITTERSLPVLLSAIEAGRAAGRLHPGPFTLGLFERWFLRSLEPPPRRRVRTPALFTPGGPLDVETTLARWLRLQDRFAEAIRAADGLDLRALRVRSQFGPVSFTLDGTFAVLLAHQRRHVWQARAVRTAPDFPPA